MWPDVITNIFMTHEVNQSGSNKAQIFFTIRNNICFWWKLWKYNIFLYYCMRPKKTGQKKGRQVTIMTRTTRCRLTGKHKDKSHFIEACCIHLYDRNDKIITVQWIFRPFYTGIISSISFFARILCSGRVYLWQSSVWQRTFTISRPDIWLWDGGHNTPFPLSRIIEESMVKETDASSLVKNSVTWMEWLSEYC